MEAFHAPHASASQTRPVVVAMPHFLSAAFSVLMFGLVLLAFSHAGLVVLAGVRHGMAP